MTNFNNQNLAGLLSEALGLEPGDGRSQFSGISREILRRALDHSSEPMNFGQLLAILEELGGDATTVDAVRKTVDADPAQSVHEFVDRYVRESRPD